MLFRSDRVRHKFPLRATYFRQVLPHVRGFPTLRVLRFDQDSPSASGGLSLSQYSSAFLHCFPVRHLGSGITLCLGFPFRASISVYLTTAFPQPGAYGASQVLRRISSCMPQPEDSGGHPHPHPDGCFMLASDTLKPSPSATNLFRSCASFQGTRLPLRPAGFSVYASPTLFASSLPPDSAAGATLDTGGWLALARPGLPPG